MIVEDEEYAKKTLNDISYFRLIKAYSLNLKSKNGKYREQVTFGQLVDLYLFNANFRQIIFPEIEKIEIPITNKLIIKDLLNFDTIFMSIILSWDKHTVKKKYLVYIYELILLENPTQYIPFL